MRSSCSSTDNVQGSVVVVAVILSLAAQSLVRDCFKFIIQRLWGNVAVQSKFGEYRGEVDNSAIVYSFAEKFLGKFPQLKV